MLDVALMPKLNLIKDQLISDSPYLRICLSISDDYLLLFYLVDSFKNKIDVVAMINLKPVSLDFCFVQIFNYYMSNIAGVKNYTH